MSILFSSAKRQARSRLTLRDVDRKPAHRPTVYGVIDIISPVHDRFSGAEDEVLDALAEDLPDLVTACVTARQFSG
jgi:hypothetical protein